ncbi:chaplin family protein [Spirillospora sp. NPDC048911]|uniref:chaplin family protein n=1 Tax=Spirillospora sp. NPDC048911 TaxID=3364527 RepID=UPI0037155EE6
MRNWAKNSARAALVVAGMTAVNTGIAGGTRADSNGGALGLLANNQGGSPISVPIDFSGNSAAVLGVAKSHSQGGAHVINVDEGGGSSSGALSAGNGNQMRAPVSVPINICGNTLAVLGVGKAACEGSATVINHGSSSGRGGILSGNRGRAPISIPINICGNAAAVLGTASAYCGGGAHSINDGTGYGKGTGGFGGFGGSHSSAPVSAPVTGPGRQAAPHSVAGKPAKAMPTKRNPAGKPAKALPAKRNPAGKPVHKAAPTTKRDPSAKSMHKAVHKAVPSTKRNTAGKLAHKKLPSTKRTAGGRMSRQARPFLAGAPAGLSSTRRLAKPPWQWNDDTVMPKAAQTVQDLIRSLGIPVPSPEHAKDYRPTLATVQGIPLTVAGNPILR